MSDFTVKLPGGKLWTPQLAEKIDETKCIGCGRCFRVCGRDVLQLVGLTEEGERLAVCLDPDSDDYDDDDAEYLKKMTTIANPENCVGCEASMKICPKKMLYARPRAADRLNYSTTLAGP